MKKNIVSELVIDNVYVTGQTIRYFTNWISQKKSRMAFAGLMLLSTASGIYYGRMPSEEELLKTTSPLVARHGELERQLKYYTPITGLEAVENPERLEMMVGEKRNIHQEFVSIDTSAEYIRQLEDYSKKHKKRVYGLNLSIAGFALGLYGFIISWVRGAKSEDHT